jgi:hypothetical protein
MNILKFGYIKFPYIYESQIKDSNIQATGNTQVQNPWHQVTVTTKLHMVPRNTCTSSVRQILHDTLRAPTILMWSYISR